MNIGIDIDDTLVDSTKEMQNVIEKYDPSGDVVEHIEEIMTGGVPTENVQKFFDRYLLQITRNLKIKENAVEVIRDLKEKGHKIVFITARTDNECKGSEEVTLDYLKRNNVPYDKIFFNALDKAKICTENNIDLMIDDSVKHCEAVKEAGIQTFLFTSIVNENKKTNIKRVENWTELETEINKIINRQTV